MQETGTKAMPFREWMRQALFDPDTGYYTTNVRTVGRRGDFSTSATAGTLLGEAVAAWLRNQMHHHPHVQAVIEVGGGNGALSATVRQALGWWRRRKMQWHMVETSPVLRPQQQEKLGRGAAVWHESMAAAMEASGGRAFIFHNELVDAFPVTLLQWDEAGQVWREVWVRRVGAEWREELGELPVNGTARAGWTGHALRDKQRVEVHDSYREWLNEWAPAWREGAMLTVDYGDEFPAVYHRQPKGTLRAYFAQQRLTGMELYQRMGKQDITADVNFTDLQAWGGSLGWDTETFESQGDFIRRHVKAAGERARRSAADSFVLEQEGAGGAFKALVQSPGGVVGSRL
ncbi:MAG TPA: SAM-dependent methyltransferase [Candidatus Saccharimonadia bacterium]|nr:SAM-dependent methyltransferase [Candidatus Saccharimonadia bacterium]